MDWLLSEKVAPPKGVLIEGLWRTGEGPDRVTGWVRHDTFQASNGSWYTLLSQVTCPLYWRHQQDVPAQESGVLLSS